MLNSLQSIFRNIPMQEPGGGISITWLLFLESTGQGGAVGSEKGKMARNNMVKFVENAA